MAGYDYVAQNKGEGYGEQESGTVMAPDMETALERAKEDTDKRIVKLDRVNWHE